MGIGRKIAVVALMFSLAVLAACGPAQLKSKAGLNKATSALVPRLGLLPEQDLGALPSNIRAMIPGTYTINLKKTYADGSSLNQQMTVTLSERQPSGSPLTYAYGVFQSSGPIGDFQVESYLGIGLDHEVVSGDVIYGLVSSPFDIRPLHVHPVVLSVNLVFTSGTAYSAPESGLAAVDCSADPIQCQSISLLKSVNFTGDFLKR